jgi:hypothetical protein
MKFMGVTSIFFEVFYFREFIAVEKSDVSRRMSIILYY